MPLSLSKLFLSLIFLIVPFYLGSQTTSVSDQVDLADLTIDSLKSRQDELGRLGKSKELLEVLLVLEKKVAVASGDTSEAYIDIISGLSFTYEALGDFDTAETYYDKTLGLLKTTLGTQSPAYIKNLAWYGDFLKNKGDYTAAEMYLKQAYQLGQENEDAFDDPSELAATYGFLANYYRSTFQHKKALPLYIKEKELFEQRIGEQDPEYGAVLSNLAITYGTFGQFDKALKLNQKAVSLTEKYLGTDNFAYGQRVNNLALANVKLQKYQVADSLYKITLQNALQLFGNEHLQYAIRLVNMGVNNLHMGQYEKAETQIHEARSILSQKLPKYHKFMVSVNAHYAKALAHLGRKKAAAECLIEAVRFVENVEEKGFKRLSVKDYEDAGWLFEIPGFEAEAADYYKGANEGSLMYLQHGFDYFSEGGQLQYAASLKPQLDRFESYAFRHSNQSDFVSQGLDNELISNGLLFKNKERLIKIMKASTDSLLQQQFKEWEKQKEILAKQYSLPASRRAKDFESLIQQTEELEETLARASVPFKEAHQYTGWEAIAAVLKKGEIAIQFSSFQYFPTGQQLASDSILYVAYLIKKDDVAPKMVFLFEEQQLSNLRNVRKLYGKDPNSHNNLQKLIWEPLAKELEKIHTVYFSPTALLHRINFSAIPIDNKTSISDRFNLYQLGSLRLLLFPHKITTSEPIQAVLFGGIDYENDAESTVTDSYKDSVSIVSISSKWQNMDRAFLGNDWSSLQWTEREITEIASILQTSKATVEIYSESTASEAAFKQLGKTGPSPNILHLATHGYFFPDPKKEAKLGFRSAEHPLIRSGLILAGANKAWNGGETIPGAEDGILTAYEIAQMDLSNTELVVLSACETGLGDIQGNEGVYGLQRAFKMAGVKHVIMSLWNVKDRQSMEFMTAFYSEWLENKKEIPSAFQAAQKTIREKYALPFNPFLWAGFVLIE